MYADLPVKESCIEDRAKLLRDSLENIIEIEK